MPPFPAHPIRQAIRAMRPSAQANAMWRSPGSAPSPPIPISFAAIRLSTVTAKCTEITHGSRRHASRLGIAATPFRRTLPRERSDRSRLVWGEARPKQIWHRHFLRNGAQLVQQPFCQHYPLMKSCPHPRYIARKRAGKSIPLQALCERPASYAIAHGSINYSARY